MGKLLQIARDRHQCGKLVSGDLSTQKNTMLEILDSHPDTRHLAERVKRCDRRFPCNSKFCPVCSNPKRRPDNRRIDRSRAPDRRSANWTKVKAKGTVLNYQVRTAQNLTIPFDGLPLACLHVITANLVVVAMDDNLDRVGKRLRKRLYKFLKKKFPKSIVRGRIDIAVKWADDLNSSFPVEDLPEFCQGSELSHSRVAMVHLHAVQFDNHRTRTTVSGLWRDEFPGKNRICVRKPKPETVQKDGRITHGIQGAFEYACLEKVEIKFGDESKDALLEFARLDSTWGRANRNVRFGTRTDDTLRSIDPERLGYLEGLYEKGPDTLAPVDVGHDHHIRCSFLASLSSPIPPAPRKCHGRKRLFRPFPVIFNMRLYSNSLRQKWTQPVEFYRLRKAIPRQTFCKWQFCRSP